MCVGENCACQAVRYVNAQLGALYENAIDCLKKHNPSQKPPEQSRYSHALAEFTYAPPNARREVFFKATFDKPKLEFICNHDALLQLIIKDGYYRLDHSAASAINYSDKPQELKNVEVSFRVPFSTRSLPVDDEVLKRSQNPLQLIVLDLTKARLVSMAPAMTTSQEAFAYYLKEYLNFLDQAGNHILFSIPDADDARYRLTIDYSILDGPLLDVDMIHGIGVEKINEYLSFVWLKADMLARGDRDIDDWKSLCLAEYRSTWHSRPDLHEHFRLRLGAPRVKPICSREAIIYFSVDEVLVSQDADFTQRPPPPKYSGWKIAVLVNIVHEFDGFVTRCAFDPTSARLCPAHSTYGDLDGHDESVQIWWTRIVEFFSTEYLGMMGAVNLNVIYFSDSRSPIAAPGSIPSYDDVDVDVIDGDSSPDLLEWEKTISDCHISGFDQVVTISQSTINRLFGYLWTAAQSQTHRDHALVEWQYEDLFSAHFRPATMRFLSNERAIIWLYLEHGDFEVLSDQSPRSDSKYHVDGWHLAFEVALKKVPLPEVGDSEFWITKYKETSVYRAHGGREDRGLECIVLDFADAEFIYQFSNFAGLFQQSRDQTHMASSGDQVRTVINYLQRHYLPCLAQSGLNIIHTVPIRKVETSLMSVECLTTMHFHVYSASTITLENWSHASGSAEPVIVVLGMIQFRPLPAPCLPYSSSLTIRVSKKISYGTIRFTRSAFLDRCILNGLIQINSHTTLIPIFSSIVGPRLTLELNTWAENKWKGTQECEWKESLEHAGLMKYNWERQDKWDTTQSDGLSYSATCSTCNVVEIPIAARKRSLDIRISGETHLGMSFNSQVRSGSAEAIAKWSAVISIQSESDGLVVKVIGDLTPTIEAPGPTILGTLPDLRQKLYDHLPKTIDLSQVLDELKAFEGAWHYGYLGLRPYCLANPVINDKGDAIFELRPQGEGSTSVTLSNGGMNSMNGSKGHTFRPGQLSSLFSQKSPNTFTANPFRSSTPSTSMIDGRNSPLPNGSHRNDTPSSAPNVSATMGQAVEGEAGEAANTMDGNTGNDEPTPAVGEGGDNQQDDGTGNGASQ